MNRHAVALVAGCLALSGCLGGLAFGSTGSQDTPGSGSPTLTPAPVDPAPTPTPTQARTPEPAITPVTPTGDPGLKGPRTDRGALSVSYVVTGESFPSNVSHVYVDFVAYVTEKSDDVGPCIGTHSLYSNRYDPTPTPLPTPAGRCEAFDAGRVDVANLAGATVLGPFEANATYSGAHALFVSDVTVVLDDGTEATDVYDTNFRAIEVSGRPDGMYGVSFSVTDLAGTNATVAWRYDVDAEPFEPGVNATSAGETVANGSL
ncbi:MAG: hypothetical protein ABEJ40_05855 [Haloarculaceae archaeon]